MNESFEARLRCAAVAGWWTLLVAIGVLLVDWLMYLIIVPLRPGVVLTAWGPGADWEMVGRVWFWFLAGYKVLLFLATLVLLWLTLWARQLRKRTGEQPI